MDLSGLNAIATTYFLVIHLVSFLVLAIYTLQLFRVRALRRNIFDELGEECIRTIVRPPVLLWLYIASIVIVFIASTVYFFGLFSVTIS